MKVKLTKKREVFNFSKPYIIAELGSNHNGDMKLARRLIKEAKIAGADCVKFQSWTKDTIFSKKVYDDNKFLKDDYRNRKDYSLKSIVEAYSISEKQLLEMKKYADSLGLDCISTPFSKSEVDFLVKKLKAPFIKVASMDAVNYPFLKYIAKKDLPIVLSDGFCELHELDKAVRIIEEAGNKKIVLLHCVSNYPPQDTEVNLNNIDSLQKLYPYPIGFSDHTIGTAIPLASVAKGACIVEKHFTLDKDMPGWDHKVSASPTELKTICVDSKRIWASLGSTRIIPVEKNNRKQAYRRSIVAARDIGRGQKIKLSDLDFKRPGTGLMPEYCNFIVDKIAKRNINKDDIIKMDDF